MKLLVTISATFLIAAGVANDAAWADSMVSKQSNVVWRKQDDCVHAAFLKFPDYTRESNANRDRATRECEIKNHLPPRQSLIVSPVKTIPDADAD